LIIFKSGVSYHGGFKHNKPFGKGILVKDNKEYEGNFDENLTLDGVY